MQPDGRLPRATITEEIYENYAEVRKAKVKGMAGPFGLECFKRWRTHKSDNIIDARWVVTWKMVEGNVGVKCRFAVRGFQY